ncbi:uncharacterized protein TNCV_7641 [Trichonephila clavipes]|nr:uncharacterized protein TNCV_7641 [Trichonephila clavipes]
MVSWEYLWPTLRCRRVAEVSPLLLIGWWYLSSVSPKRHCCRVSASDKGCRVYPLDPRPDAVELYSGCTPFKRHAWFCQMTGTLPPLLDSVVGGGTPGRSFLRVFMDWNMLCPAVIPNLRPSCQTLNCYQYNPNDENITQIKCPPLQLLQPLLSVPQPDKSNSVSTLSSATQADLLPSTSSTAATVSEPPHLVPVSDTLLSTTSNMFTPIEPSSSILSASLSNSSIQPPSASSTQNLKKKSKPRDRKRKKKEVLKSIIDIKMAQHTPRKPAPVEYSTDEEDMIVYDVEENEFESNPDCVRKR